MRDYINIVKKLFEAPLADLSYDFDQTLPEIDSLDPDNGDQQRFRPQNIKYITSPKYRLIAEKKLSKVPFDLCLLGRSPSYPR